MAKKAKKKTVKKETKKKPVKDVKNKQQAGGVTKAGQEHEDDFSGDELKQLDKALKEADPGEPPTLEEFKKMSERMRSENVAKDSE